VPIIEIICEEGRVDSFKAAAEHHEVDTIWGDIANENGLCSMRMYISEDKLQKVLDTFQSLTGPDSTARVFVLPVDSIYPREVQEKEKDKNTLLKNREALYLEVEKGTQLNRTFILLVILSTIVVSIGLAENNVAIIIGAMVIAPLLGPNLGLSLGIALGDYPLIIQSMKTNLSGLSITIFLAFLIGQFWPINFTNYEVISRTDVGLAGIVLALASGMAAVLSLTTKVSSVLVGVMVAVALLPPAAVFGMMVGNAQYQLAIGALLLLSINIVCVNMSAQFVLLIQGVRPRTWYEKRKANQSKLINILILFLLLIILITVIIIRQKLQ
jgi:uncharacterized hydrophobic protein (TIGR00341 family)